MCMYITWGADYDSAGLGWGLRLCTSNQFQSWWPHCEHQSQMPKPKRMAKTDHREHQRTMGGGEAAEEEGTRAWTLGADQVPLPTCGMAWVLVHGVPGRTLTYSLQEVLFWDAVGDLFPQCSDWWSYMQLSRYAVLDLLLNLSGPQFPHFQKC